jgi:hypothetical protein
MPTQPNLPPPLPARAAPREPLPGAPRREPGTGFYDAQLPHNRRGGGRRVLYILAIVVGVMGVAGIAVWLIGRAESAATEAKWERTKSAVADIAYVLSDYIAVAPDSPPAPTGVPVAWATIREAVGGPVLDLPFLDDADVTVEFIDPESARRNNSLFRVRVNGDGSRNPDAPPGTYGLDDKGRTYGSLGDQYDRVLYGSPYGYGYDYGYGYGYP